MGSTEGPLAEEEEQWETLEDLEVLFEDSLVASGAAGLFDEGAVLGDETEETEEGVPLDSEGGPEEEVWLMFDDVSVTPFDIKNLDAVAFGGNTSVKVSEWAASPLLTGAEFDVCAMAGQIRDPILLHEELVEQLSERNALLLFYDRVAEDAEDEDTARDSEEKEEQEAGAKKKKPPIVFDGPPTSAILSTTVAEIENANHRNALLRHRFDPAFLSFLMDTARVRAQQLASPAAAAVHDEGVGPDPVLEDLAHVFMESVMRLRSICRPLGPAPGGKDKGSHRSRSRRHSGDGASIEWDVLFDVERTEKSLGDAMVESLLQLAQAHPPSLKWLVRQLVGSDMSPTAAPTQQHHGSDAEEEQKEGAGAGAGAGAEHHGGDRRGVQPPPPPTTKDSGQAEAASATSPPPSWLVTGLLQCSHEPARVVFSSLFESLLDLCARDKHERSVAKADIARLERWSRSQIELQRQRQSYSRATKALSMAKRVTDQTKLQLRELQRGMQHAQQNFSWARKRARLPALKPDALVFVEDSVSDLLSQPSHEGTGLGRTEFAELQQLRDDWKNCSIEFEQTSELLGRWELEVEVKRKAMQASEAEMKVCAVSLKCHDH